MPPPGSLPSFGAIRSGGEHHPGWPARLGPVDVGGEPLLLRPLRRSDGPDWRALRIRDRVLLEPWDATSVRDWAARHTAASWRRHRTSLYSAARLGESMPFAITLAGRFAGQLTVGGIQRGPVQSAWLGYWVQSQVQGRGVATAAVALTVGHAFGMAQLHRMEATVAPDNRASQAVLARLGFRPEGRLVRYLDVGGGWTDHLLFALTTEDVPGGTAELLGRCRRPTD